jgi:hypothetical protein
MSKWLRSLLISITAVALVAGGAVADPDRVGENGDPDRPEIAEPIDKTNGLIDSAGAGGGSSMNSSDQSTQVSDDWKILLQVYLKLIRIFAG